MMTENISGKLMLLLFAALYAALGAGAVATVTLAERSVFYLPSYENSVGCQRFKLYANLAEQVEYDPLTKQIWTVGKLKDRYLTIIKPIIFSSFP